MTSKLEALMISEGRDRAEAAYNRSIGKGQIAYVDRGRHLISGDTTRFMDWIARWRARCKADYDGLHPMEKFVYDSLTKCEYPGLETPYSIEGKHLSFVVTNYVFTKMGGTFSEPVRMFKAQSELGRQVQEQMLFSMFKKLDKETWTKSQKYTKNSSAYIQKQAAVKAFRAKGRRPILWPLKDRSQIGGWLLEAFRLATGHIVFKSIKKRGWLPIVELTPEVWDYVSRSTDDDIHYRPRYTPTDLEPKPWTGQYKGGFHEDQLQESAILASGQNDEYTFFEDKDLGEALPAISALQKTAWALSPLASSVFQHFIDHSLDRAGLVPSKAQELPERRYNEDGTRCKFTGKIRAQIYESNRKNLSKRTAYSRAIRITDRLKPPFYFIHRLDGRGRMYSFGDFLNPQSGDWARGQLVFHEAVPVDDEGLRWLKIQGANLAGQDKLPFDERVKWVDDHIDLIAATAEDPYRSTDWEDFDEPFQFLSWAEDFVGVLGGGPSSCPVALDGSNNGLQVFSLLLRDRNMASATNVVPVERPNDIYQTVADRALTLLNDSTYGLDEKASLSNRWLDFFSKHYRGHFPRKLAKRPVMTKCYNVSQYRVTDYIVEWILEEHPDAFPTNEAFKMGKHLSKYLWDAMEDMLDGAASGMKWLKDSALQIVKETGEVPWWTSPSGFPVYRPYYKPAFEKVSLVFGQQTKLRGVMVGEDRTRPRTRKVVNGVAPNFIHGIDAAIAHRLAIRLEEMGVPAMRFVHDSFAVHAQWAAVLSKTIREVVYEVMEEDQLLNLKDEWEGRYKVQLPDLPEYGDLDPREVLDAEYAYS